MWCLLDNERRLQQNEPCLQKQQMTHSLNILYMYQCPAFLQPHDNNLIMKKFQLDKSHLQIIEIHIGSHLSIT